MSSAKPRRKVSFHDKPVVINDKLPPELRPENDPEPKKRTEFNLWETIVIGVVVVGTGLIILAAARNSITWHLQHFWGASGDFWQNQWGKFHDWFEGDTFTMSVWGGYIVVSAAFWGVNFLLMLLDVFSKPEALVQYKIQMDKNRPLEVKKLMNAIAVCMFNNTVVTIPFMLVMYHVSQWRGCDLGRELPTFHWVLFELLVFIIVEEILFYYTHRFCHIPWMYKRVHKKHHEWTAPIGIIAIYCHPVEHIVSNLSPVFAGPILMGSHVATSWLWFILALTATTVSHCGYHFPFLPSSEFHDFHHAKFNYCYGVLGFLDRLHGTDKMFRESKAYQRHTILLSTTPMSQLIPDDKKTNK